MLENIKKIRRNHVLDYHKGQYYGDNIVVVAAGGMNHKDVLDICEKSFESISPINPKLGKPRFEKAVFTPGHMWINQPEIESAHSIMVHEAPGYLNPDYIGFLLLNYLISESSHSNKSMVSSLGNEAAFSMLGSKTSLLQSGHTFKGMFLPYAEVGIFTMYVQTSHEDVRDSEDILKAYLDDLIYSLRPEDIERGFNK